MVSSPLVSPVDPVKQDLLDTPMEESQEVEWTCEEKQRTRKKVKVRRRRKHVTEGSSECPRPSRKRARDEDAGSDEAYRTNHHASRQKEKRRRGHDSAAPNAFIDPDATQGASPADTSWKDMIQNRWADFDDSDEGELFGADKAKDQRSRAKSKGKDDNWISDGSSSGIPDHSSNPSDESSVRKKKRKEKKSRRHRDKSDDSLEDHPAEAHQNNEDHSDHEMDSEDDEEMDGVWNALIVSATLGRNITVAKRDKKTERSQSRRHAEERPSTSDSGLFKVDELEESLYAQWREMQSKSLIDPPVPTLEPVEIPINADDESDVPTGDSEVYGVDDLARLQREADAAERKIRERQDEAYAQKKREEKKQLEKEADLRKARAEAGRIRQNRIMSVHMLKHLNPFMMNWTTQDCDGANLPHVSSIKDLSGRKLEEAKKIFWKNHELAITWCQQHGLIQPVHGKARGLSQLFRTDTSRIWSMVDQHFPIESKVIRDLTATSDAERRYYENYAKLHNLQEMEKITDRKIKAMTRSKKEEAPKERRVHFCGDTEDKIRSGSSIDSSGHNEGNVIMEETRDLPSPPSDSHGNSDLELQDVPHRQPSFDSNKDTTIISSVEQSPPTGQSHHLMESEQKLDDKFSSVASDCDQDFREDRAKGTADSSHLDRQKSPPEPKTRAWPSDEGLVSMLEAKRAREKQRRRDRRAALHKKRVIMAQSGMLDDEASESDDDEGVQSSIEAQQYQKWRDYIKGVRDVSSLKGEDRKLVEELIAKRQAKKELQKEAEAFEDDDDSESDVDGLIATATEEIAAANALNEDNIKELFHARQQDEEERIFRERFTMEGIARRRVRRSIDIGDGLGTGEDMHRRERERLERQALQADMEDEEVSYSYESYSDGDREEQRNSRRARKAERAAQRARQSVMEKLDKEDENLDDWMKHNSSRMKVDVDQKDPDDGHIEYIPLKFGAEGAAETLASLRLNQENIGVIAQTKRNPWSLDNDGSEDEDSDGGLTMNF